MDQLHSIVPPPELVQQWSYDWHRAKVKHVGCAEYIATQAARWGADQELLACGNYLEKCAAWEPEDVTEMYNYRRPRPPSLKEQALKALTKIEDNEATYFDSSVIRRALEQLDD